MNTRSKLVWLIIIATLVRCIVATVIELGNDEVYYLSYARHLQWNYFDHPPMVALLIRLTTFNLHFQNEFFVRLGPIILAAVNTVLIFNIAKKVKNEKAAMIVSLLFTASPYCSIIAGTFILPDSAQLFFWIAGISLLVDIISRRPQSGKLNCQLLLYGVVAGLCILCKVHGIFLWVGFIFYVILYQRSLLLNPYLYLAAILTAIVISPILIWNIQNNFITYTFHSNRVAINSQVNPAGFMRELAGGIFYNNIINYSLIIYSIAGFLKPNHIISVRVKRLLLLLSLPLIFLLLFISIFRDTLPHWSGPAYSSLLLLTACYLSDKVGSGGVTGKFLKRLCNISVYILTTIIFSGILLINFMPGTIGKKDSENLGDGDFTLDMYGWNQMKVIFKNIYDAGLKSGVTTTFIVSNKWFPGAHIDNYIAQPLQLDFIAIGDFNDIHTYAWLNKYRRQLKPGNDAYFITVSDNFCDPYQKYKAIFGEITKPIIVQQFRRGQPVRNILIFLLKNYKGDVK